MTTPFALFLVSAGLITVAGLIQALNDTGKVGR